MEMKMTKSAKNHHKKQKCDNKRIPDLSIRNKEVKYNKECKAITSEIFRTNVSRIQKIVGKAFEHKNYFIKELQGINFRVKEELQEYKLDLEKKCDIIKQLEAEKEEFKIITLAEVEKFDVTYKNKIDTLEVDKREMENLLLKQEIMLKDHEKSIEQLKSDLCVKNMVSSKDDNDQKESPLQKDELIRLKDIEILDLDKNCKEYKFEPAQHRNDDEDNLVRSDYEITGNSNFVCQFCDQKIVGLQHFLVHIKDQEIHSQDIRTVLACPYEGCENDSEHEDSKKDNSPLHCPVRGCIFKPAWNSDYKISTSWKLLNTIEDHINAKHARMNPFTCDKCGKGFKSKMSHEYHKRRHLDCIYCDSCQHFFATTDKYVNHNSKCGKEGSKQYSCDNCDKIFLSKGNLYTHKRIHSNVKFPCDVCGKKFTQKGNRDTHAAKKHNKNN